MKRLVAIVLALALSASAAHAFPTIIGNTSRVAQSWCLCDTIAIPAGPTGRSRTIYLVQPSSGVEGEIDSVVTAWRAGGATPAFRRIQGMRWSGGQDPATQASILVTIYRDGATSRNKLELYPDVWVRLPIEADSIAVYSLNSSAQRLTYCAW